jgi:hypothetical protein
MLPDILARDGGQRRLKRGGRYGGVARALLASWLACGRTNTDHRNDTAGTTEDRNVHVLSEKVVNKR